MQTGALYVEYFLCCVSVKVNKLTVHFSVYFLSVIYQKPSRDDWKGGMDALTFSLEHQKSLNRSLLEIHRVAGENSDPHVSIQFIFLYISVFKSELLCVLCIQI